MEIYQRIESLQQQMRSAQKEERAALRTELVELYVRYGEFLKSSDHPNRQQAIQSLHKALRLAPHHPIAHYRLGHLYYRQKQISEAIKHFIQIQGHPELDRVQRYLVNRLLVNCMLTRTKDIIEEMEEDDELNDERIPLFTAQVQIPTIEDLQLMYMYKLTAAGKELIYVTAGNEWFDEQNDYDLCLIRRQQGWVMRIKGIYGESTLSLAEYQLLYAIVQTKKPLSNEMIIERFMGNIMPQENSLRQMWLRLNKKFKGRLDEFIECTKVERRNMYRLKEGVAYAIVCPADEILP